MYSKIQKRWYIKGNRKIICSCDRLRARTFHVRRKSLRARYTHAYERARNFLRHASILVVTLGRRVLFRLG